MDSLGEYPGPAVPLQTPDDGKVEPMVREDPRHPPRGRRSVHGQYHVHPAGHEPGQTGGDGLRIACGGMQHPHLDLPVLGPGGKRRALDEPFREVGGQIEEQRGPVPFDPVSLAPRVRQGLGQVLFLAGQVLGSPPGLHRVEQHQRSGTGEFMEEAARPGQPRQPRLHAGKPHTLGDAVPDRVGPRFGRPQHPGGFANRPVGSELTSRIGAQFPHASHRPLRADREGPYLVDDVTPEVDPHRGVGLGGEDIYDASPDGELTPRLDPFGPGVPGLVETLYETLELHLGAGPGHHRPGRGPAHPLDSSPDRCDHHETAGNPGHPVPDLGAAGHGPCVGGHMLEGEGLPGGEEHDVVDEQPEVGGQVLGLAFGGDHRQQGSLRLPGEAPYRDGPGRGGHDQAPRGLGKVAGTPTIQQD